MEKIMCIIHKVKYPMPINQRFYHIYLHDIFMERCIIKCQLSDDVIYHLRIVCSSQNQLFLHIHFMLRQHLMVLSLYKQYHFYAKIIILEQCKQ